MSWEGNWDSTKTIFTGSYAFADGTVFKGEARRFDKQTLLHKWPNMGQMEVDMPVEPHFQFTGTWIKDDHAGSPMMPPEPPSPAPPPPPLSTPDAA